MLGPAQRGSSCGISAATFPGKRHGAGFPSGDVTVHGTCLPEVERAVAARATAACCSASKSSTSFAVPLEKASAWAGATTLSFTGSKNGTAFSSAVGAAGFSKGAAEVHFPPAPRRPPNVHENPATGPAFIAPSMAFATSAAG